MELYSLIGLTILPGIVWASAIYVSVSKSGFASKLRAARNAGSKQKIGEGARSWAFYAVLVYLTALGATVVWLKAQQFINAPSLAVRFARDLTLGVLLGLTITGIIPVFLALQPKPRKFSLPVLAGIGSSPAVRAFALLLVVCTEELWRAACLSSVISGGASRPQALLVVSVAYSLAYLAVGTGPALSEGVVGAALGAVYLRSGSILVPIAAHLILRTQLLLAVLAAAPNAGPTEMRRSSFTKCPSCSNPLNLRQVTFDVNESFFCPFCHARLTSSDSRRRFVRWGSVFLIMPILFWCSALFPDFMSGANYWTVLAATPVFGAGLFSMLHLLFPPKLEFGDADFLRLNLGDQVGREDTEPHSDSK